MTLLIAALFAAETFSPALAHAEHCTDKWSQKSSVEQKYDKVVWGELGGEEYAKLVAAVAAAVLTDGIASPLVFEVFAEALGEMVFELGTDVGQEVAAELLNDVLNSGKIKTIKNITVGRQVWKREECAPSCDDKWKLCAPVPATNAFYVAWDYGIPGNDAAGGKCVRNNWKFNHGEPSYLSGVPGFWPVCDVGERWTFVRQDDGTYCVQNDYRITHGETPWLSENGVFFDWCAQGERWNLLLQNDGSYCIQNKWRADPNEESFLSDNGSFFGECAQGETWTIH
jgi:hypothetical protein